MDVKRVYICALHRPCSTMDSTRVSEALDPGSIPGKATKTPNDDSEFFYEDILCVYIVFIKS